MALIEGRKLGVWEADGEGEGEGEGLERNERGVEPWRKEEEIESLSKLSFFSNSNGETSQKLH